MKEQNVASEILSDIVTHMKYAKYIPELKRRETYEEIIDRNKAMHVRRYPELKKEIDEAYDYVYDRQVLPSGRSLQFAGKAIEVSPARIFNCSALAIKDIKAFSEVMFLLLMGCGTGYSVQKAHIRQLPPLQGVEKPVGKQRKKRYLVQDSIVGWADAIKALMESYFYHEREIDYDFSDIRKKGAPLVTSGGKAPGPEPLRVCLNKIASLLENVVATRGPGTKLTPLEAHDILCFLADAVLCGGIRRSASICLFSLDDKEMLECKFGDWWETNPQRGRANNSAVIDRSLITKEVFDDLWDKVEASGSGEPGLFFSNDVELLTNPCCEISLQSYSFCNLTTLNASTVETQEDLNTRVRMAARIATLQAGYTDFYYLRKEWRELVEEEALIGVSMTGLASENVLSLNFKEAAQIVKDENEEFAAKMGINKAHRTTCVKPEGCQVPETLIVSDKGIFTLDELGDKAGEDWQKLRYGITSVATDKNIQEVGKFYNNGFKDTKKITLDSGLILEATHNHMYRVLRDDAYVWVEAKDIIEGDILPYALGSYTGGTYQEFQYSQIIDEHSHNSIMLPEQYVLDEDFAWLLGLYNADGSNHAKGIRISGNWNERKGFDKAQRIIKEKFGLDSTITKHNQNETDLRCQLVVNSTYLPKMFEEFGILKGRSDEIVVPLAVRMSPPSVIKSFYDGFFVGDGNFSDVKAPSFSTTSREFAMSTVVILRSLGIDCKVRLVGRRVGNYGDKQQYWVSVRQGRSVEHRYVSIHNREIWKKLDDLGMSNLSFDTVISIEDSENYTLDIEVPESNTYVANSYISHNTASLVLGTSSGVHAWYADYYWRRVSVGKEEAIYSYLAENHPELVEDDYFRPSTMAKIKVPQKAPEGAMLRYETALDTLERVKMLSLDWIQGGHREGDNFNNVSCTISVRDNEWDEVGEWMWENRDNYTGIAVLPFDGGSYTQSPFEECTKEEYEEAMKHLTNIDLTQVIEEDDMTDLQGEVACGGGACEIT